MTAGTSLTCNAGIGGNMIPIFTEPSIKQLLTGYDKKIPGDFSLYSRKARE